jgi:predicted kinase
MRQFPQDQQFDRRLQRDDFDFDECRQLAKIIADFHRNLPAVTSEQEFGEPRLVHKPVADNFKQIRNLIRHEEHLVALNTLQDWSENQFERHRSDMAQRKRDGFVRECHGDMHLRNIARYRGEIVIFDGIEFNENLRWIDVMSELAFIVMDFFDHVRPDFANVLLNSYLENSGDYAGVRLLRFYLVYRAMVRAKVACIRAHQSDIEEAERRESMDEFHHYLGLADNFTQPTQPFLAITHGLSGTGKTYISGDLLKKLPAIRLRSDVERKRLHGLESQQSSRSQVGRGIYTSKATEQTYDHLLTCSDTLLQERWPVIVDATFLQRGMRNRFRQLAKKHNVPFLILHFEASEQTLRERIQGRRQSGRDASEAGLTVLNRQIGSQEVLDAAETDHALIIDSETAPDTETLSKRILRRLDISGEVQTSRD